MEEPTPHAAVMARDAEGRPTGKCAVCGRAVRFRERRSFNRGRDLLGMQERLFLGHYNRRLDVLPSR